MFNAILADASGATEALSSLFTSLGADFTPETLVGILGIPLAVCVGLFLFWFGGRKIVRMITSALRSGRLKI